MQDHRQDHHQDHRQDTYGDHRRPAAHPRSRRVFVVSNRGEPAARLASALGLVLPCRLIRPGGPWPLGRPFAFVIDLDPRAADEAWIEAAARRARTDGAPCLYIARGAAPDAAGPQHFGSPTVLRGTGATGGIVAELERLLDAERAAVRAEQAARVRLDARVGAATGAVTGLFAAAATGAPVSAREAEAGTEIVLAAVAEAGIGAWLDRLRQHHAGVYQHSLSVAGFAAAFADVLGLNPRDSRRLAQAALMHDVGKARIPVAILDKPGPLTAAEMLVMRTHAAIGADLLAEAGGFEPAVLDAARHHHERLDGSGYPDALRDGAVGDLVRLVAICDVHSALTERRAYRPPMPARQARAIMAGMAGQLDPHLLRAYDPVLALSDGADDVPEGRAGGRPAEKTFS